MASLRRVKLSNNVPKMRRVTGVNFTVESDFLVRRTSKRLVFNCQRPGLSDPGGGKHTLQRPKTPGSLRLSASPAEPASEPE